MLCGGPGNCWQRRLQPLAAPMAAADSCSSQLLGTPSTAMGAAGKLRTASIEQLLPCK